MSGSGGSATGQAGDAGTAEQSHESSDLFASATTFITVSEKEPNESPGQAPEIILPALVEGTIDCPGDVDHFKFKVKSGQKLAFEIETPDAPPPRFNPRLEVFDTTGQEFLANIYRNIEGDGDDWVKRIEPKTIATFEQGGEYCLQVRDLTSRYGNRDFAYRILIRPQIPHIGEVKLIQSRGVLYGEIDRLNLVAGQAKKLTVMTAQEEGFSGEIVIDIDNLPPGVKAFPATGIQPVTETRSANLIGSHVNKERFRPERHKATIVLLARADAPATAVPRLARLRVWPIVQGKPGVPLLVEAIPVMLLKSAEGEERDAL